MQVALIMFRPGGDRRSFAVDRTTTTIGRREDCDLRIPVGDVSRKHCRLVMTGDNLRVQDLGSSNGTFVNGQQVQDAFLNPGDHLAIGPVNFVVQIDGIPGEDDLDVPAPQLAGETGAGGTALALEALSSGRAAAPDPPPPADDLVFNEGEVADLGDVAEVGDLLEPLPDAAPPDEMAAAEDVAPPEAPDSAEPIPSADLTLDELPDDASPPVFDLVDLDDGEADAGKLHKP